MKLFLLYLVSALLISACGSQPAAPLPAPDGAPQEIASWHDSDKVAAKRRDSVYRLYKGKPGFTYTDTLTIGDFTVTIATDYINDSLSLDEVSELNQWPIVQQQSITFRQHDSILRVFNMPTRQIEREKTNGKKILSAELVIGEVGIIKGEKQSFLVIPDASDYCVDADCPGYTAVFKLDGLPLYQLFQRDSEHDSLIVGNQRRAITDTEKGDEIVYKLNKPYGITDDATDSAYDHALPIGVIK